MGENENRQVVERFAELAEKKDWEATADLFHDDIVIEWPQSGERISGKDACLAVYQNYPGGQPRLRLRRATASGDVVVAESDIDYPDGSTWLGVGIFEVRDGKIAREVDYFAQPFEAPEWRAQFVDRM